MSANSLRPDATEVRINTIRRKGLNSDGKNPHSTPDRLRWLSEGISLSPGFGCPLAGRLARCWGSIWRSRMCVAAANTVRNGIRSGNLTKKRNVFADFIACAEHLIKRGYTSSERLAVEGGSNGGLLMGANSSRNGPNWREPSCPAWAFTICCALNWIRTASSTRPSLEPSQGLAQFKALTLLSVPQCEDRHILPSGPTDQAGEHDGTGEPFAIEKNDAGVSTGSHVLAKTNPVPQHRSGWSWDRHRAECANLQNRRTSSPSSSIKLGDRWLAGWESK